MRRFFHALATALCIFVTSCVQYPTESRSVVDFAMHCRLKPDAKLIEQIPEAIAFGVPSIKMFLWSGPSI